MSTSTRVGLCECDKCAFVAWFQFVSLRAKIHTSAPARSFFEMLEHRFEIQYTEVLSQLFYNICSLCGHYCNHPLAIRYCFHHVSMWFDIIR